MKRVVLGLVLGLLIGTAAPAFAANSEAVQAVFAKFNLQINNQKAVEIEPLVYDGTTYLPVRKTAELLGYEVGFDDATRTIELNKKGDERKMVPVSEINMDEWINITNLLQYDIKGIVSNSEISLSKNGNFIKIVLPNPNILWDDKGNVYIKKYLVKDLIDQ